MKLRATGFGMIPPDYAECRRALDVLIGPGTTFELRALPFGRSAICRSADEAIAAIRDFAHAAGIYYTLNPCQAGLDRAARNKDILSRVWLLIDVDSVRSADLSATDDEKALAARVACAIVDDLAARGWPAPILVDSGNGFHVLYRVDLPNSSLAQQWVKKVLVVLADRHDTEAANVDRSVHNAARIAKLPGTWARKGPDTPDRPHRMARLAMVPETVGAVTVEQIKALIGPDDPPADDDDRPSRTDPGGGLGTFKVRASVGSKDAYCRAALLGECARVALAPNQDRNNQLNRSAFALGGLIHLEGFSRAEAEAQLVHAARRAGLGDREIAATIRSGLDAGIMEPRDVPDDGRSNGKARDDAGTFSPPAGSRLIIWASEIKPKKVRWLWPRRIALGKMTTFAGQGGLGKTFTLCDIAARVSTGAEWPFSGGERAEAGKVLFISGEDDEDDTLVPRLIECGADLTKIAFLGPESQDHFSLAALEMLNRVVDQMDEGVRLVVIDPPTSYLGSVDDHKNAELKGLLAPLKRWAAARRVAIIYNTHINKAIGQNVEAAMRVIGSVAWVNTVRAAHMFNKDQDDNGRILFTPIKVNVGKEPKSLAYRIVDTHDDLAKVEWLCEVDITADEAMNQIKRKPRIMSARDWLIEIFREKREWQSDAFWASAKEHGITKYAIDEAKGRLDIPRARRIMGLNGNVTYTWWVPEDWPHLIAEPEQF